MIQQQQCYTAVVIYSYSLHNIGKNREQILYTAVSTGVLPYIEGGCVLLYIEHRTFTLFYSTLYFITEFVVRIIFYVTIRIYDTLIHLLLFLHCSIQ